MIVLHINSVVNTGSTGRIVEDIGSVLIENGHKSVIAYGRELGRLESNSSLIKIGNKLNTLWHGINNLIFDNHGFLRDFGTRNLVKKIAKIKPDVVALYNLHGYYIDVEVLFKFLKDERIPVVWTLFDCWAFTGHCTYFDNIACDKWKTICSECPKYNVYPKSLVDRSDRNFKIKKEIFNSLSNLKIITHSRWLHDLTMESFLNGNEISIIRAAIDVSLFRPMDTSNNPKYYFGQKRVILGCANIWSERKGLKDFFTLAEYCGSEFIIVLIGLNEQQKKGLPSNVIGIERTESIEELACWYSAADVFVNPTYMDNFPTTNLEALACGTPVITYDTGGSPEAIDEDTGYVVEQGNVAGIVNAIHELLLKDSEVTSMACRNRAVKLFNKTTRYLDYLRVFEVASKK